MAPSLGSLARSSDLALRRLQQYSDAIPLLARLTIASVFVSAGWGKLQQLEKVIDFFKTLALPVPALLAPFVALVELGCGLAVGLGIATRVASVPLIAVMIVAIRAAHWSEVEGLRSLPEMTQFLYIVLLLGLTTQGPGRWSLDALLRRRSL